jgi:hypothetical protein
MPIKHGYSKGTVGHNIKVEQSLGRPHPQAVAIALKIRDAELRKRAMRRPYSNTGMQDMPYWGDRRI